MPSRTAYIQEIRKYSSWKELKELWTNIKSGEVSEWWEPGKAFEYLVMRMFELDQAKVTYAFPVHFEEEPIEEIDGVVHLDSLSCIVEFKNQSNPVNPTPVSKLRNQLLRSQTILLPFFSVLQDLQVLLIS